MKKLLLLVMTLMLMACEESFQVTFDDGLSQKVVKVGASEMVARPADPQYENQDFLYWALDDKEYNFNSAVVDNITLKAVYETSYLVELYADGELYNAYKVKEGESLPFFESPTTDGYVVEAWLYQGFPFNLDQQIDRDLKLEAYWQKAVKATSLTVDKEEVELKPGDLKQIVSYLKPENTTDVLKFYSENEKVCTVDTNGLIIAVGSGQTYVTAYAGNVSVNIKVIIK